MRKTACSAIILLGSLVGPWVGPAGAAGPLGAAPAADPLGEWLVEDKVATIRIVDCSGHLWGVVASEKNPGGVDSNNPDKAKRSRPTLGMPVLLDMKPDEDEKDKWAGHIYNAKDGKTYEASIQVTTPNQLRVEGCVLGFLCGGQTWTRVETPPGTPPVPGAKTSATPPAPGANKMAGPAVSPSAGNKMTGPSPAAPHTTGQKAAPGTPAAATPGESDVCLLPDVAGATH